jgi:hypothetical protein
MIGFLRSKYDTEDKSTRIVIPLEYRIGFVSLNDAKECIEDIKTFLNVKLDEDLTLSVEGCPLRKHIYKVFGSYKTTPYKIIYDMVQEACLSKEIDMPGWFEHKYSS